MGSLPEGEDQGNRLLIPSLYVSQLSTRPVGILMGFILIEVAATFGTTVGVAGQIPTGASLAGLIVSPFLAALSIRYRPRNLLLAGIAFIAVSTLGCSFADSYASLLIFYALSGLGAAVVAPMISTIVGENVSEERRAGVLGILNTSTPILSTMMGLTTIWILRGGWQGAYRFFVSPIILACLVLAVLGLRRVAPPVSSGKDSRSISSGFRMILGSRSAVACLLGTALTYMVFNGIMWYVVAFYRQRWGLPQDFVGVIWSSNTFCYVIGSMLVGRVVPRFGRKKLTGLTALCIGFFTILYANAPHPYISIASNLTVSTLLALWSASSSDLALAQVPEYSGAMMSLNSGAIRLGGVLGSAVGGLLLTLGGYSLLGIVLGIAGISSFLMIFMFAKDPTHIAPAEPQTI
jgi:predicted MFS family arabinose efflux permease